jgi:hypothetical protein
MARRKKPIIKKAVNLNAEIASDDASFNGVIEALTPDNIHLRTSPEQAYFLFEREMELTIRLSSDETVSLFCNATSSHIHNHPTHGLINSVNLKVTEPSTKFQELLSLG